MWESGAVTGHGEHRLVRVALYDVDRCGGDGGVLGGDVGEDGVNLAEGGGVVMREVGRKHVPEEALAAGLWAGFVVAVDYEELRVLDVAVVGLSGGAEGPERRGEALGGCNRASVDDVDVDNGLLLLVAGTEREYPKKKLTLVLSMSGRLTSVNQRISSAGCVSSDRKRLARSKTRSSLS